MSSEPTTYTPLQTAILNGEVFEVKNLLRKSNSELEIDNNGKTLMHYVSIGTRDLGKSISLRPWLEIAEILYNKNLNVNAVDDRCNSPLHDAVGRCNPSLIFWLISKGAVNIINVDEESPVSLAYKSIQETRLKDDKKLLLRSDGTLYIVGKDGLLDFQQPKKFHCHDRFSLRSALMMALLSKLIYKGDGNDIDDFYTTSNSVIRAFTTRWGFSSVVIAEKNDARGMLLHYPQSEDNPALCVIAFRGTKTKKDVLADITAIKSGGGKHSGFHGHLSKISENLISELNKNSDTPIYITGHSLGGAMATLMAMKLYKLGFSPERLFMYTFGQPRAGTKAFQQEFDLNIKNAYIIQRYLDPVPLVPTFSGHVVGGYIHSGSLRYLDSSGQLYNDVHYQYEDINRGVMLSLPKDQAPSLQQLRKIWTGGFQQLIEVSVTEESSTLSNLGFEEYNVTKTNSDSPVSVPKKSSTQHDTNVVKNMLKGRANALGAHGMLGYLVDIARLEGRINVPFSWDNPEEAITSQQTGVSLPLDVYDVFIKGGRYNKEQEQAYAHWVKYYTNLPKISYNLDANNANIIPWINLESTVLQQISQIEEAICTQFPTLKEKNTTLPNTFHRRDISPLVEVGMYSIIDLLVKIFEKDKSMAMSYYRWLYWALPETGYALKNSSNKLLKSTCTLQREKSSPYRRGLRNSLLHLSRGTSIEILEQIAHALPQIAQADNGLQIAKLSTSMQKMQLEWLKSRQNAKLELVQIEHKIISEFISKFKSVGVKVTAVCLGSAAIGTVAGVASGVATGVTVATLSGGSATPVAIAAGIAVGSTVGAGTTGAIAGGVALKKIPKYLSSLKSTLKDMQLHLMGVVDAELDVREQHEKALIKLIKKNPTRSRIVLHMLNGLYIVLTLVHLQKVARINPHESWRKSVKFEKKPIINKNLGLFFRKVLTLINQYIGVLDLGESKIKEYLDLYESIMVSLEINADIYQKIFKNMGDELCIENSTIGVDIYKDQLKLKQSMGYLNTLLGDQLKPGKEETLALPEIPLRPKSPPISKSEPKQGLQRVGGKAKIWQVVKPYFSSDEDITKPLQSGTRSSFMPSKQD